MGKVLSAFTAKAIEAAKEVTLTERISRGLRLVAGKSARTWVYRYDWEARQRQVTLGSWPTMGIAEARRRFAELESGAQERRRSCRSYRWLEAGANCTRYRRGAL